MPEYISRSIYFKDSTTVESLEEFASNVPDCNLSKVVNAIMEKAAPELQKKDFKNKRTHIITIEVTL